MDLNRATIIGRLTRDPEIRSVPSGKAVCSVTIATGRQWVDQSGQRQKESEFHNVVLWGKLAEIAGQYMKKGARVYIEGRLRTREWTGQDGIKRYRTEIIADNMIMLDGVRTGSDSNYGPREAIPSNNFSSSEPVPEVLEEEIKVEDIPF